MKKNIFLAPLLAILLISLPTILLSSCAGTNGLAKAKPKSSCNCPHF